MRYQRGTTSIAGVVYDVATGSTFSQGFTRAPNTQPLNGNNVYQAAYGSSAIDNLHYVMVGQLLSAQAQGVSVDLYFDAAYNGGCNLDASWGYGGLGVKLMGVAVNPQ